MAVILKWQSYCCKHFEFNVAATLATSGFNNWPNIHTILADDEKSKMHLQTMLNCCELQERLSVEKTINELQEIKDKKWIIPLVSVVWVTCGHHTVVDRNKFYGSD